MKKFSLGALALLAAGCTTVGVPTVRGLEQGLTEYEDDRVAFFRHVIAADKVGDFDTDSFAERLAREKRLGVSYPCLDEDDFAACQIDAVMARLGERYTKETGDTFRVLFFIHGGLNSLSESIDRSEFETAEMIADGYHPIFLNWASDAMRSYGDEILNVRQGERIDLPDLTNSETAAGQGPNSNLSPEEFTANIDKAKERDSNPLANIAGPLKKASAPFIAATDLAKSLLTSLPSAANQITNFIDVSDSFRCEVLGDAKSLGGQDVSEEAIRQCRTADKFKNGDPTADDRAKPEFAVVIDTDDSAANGMMLPNEGDRLNFVEAAATSPLKFLSGPFVEQFGDRAWANQRRRARATTRTPGELRSDKGFPYADGTAKGTGAFSRFMACFEVWLLGGTPPNDCKQQAARPQIGKNVELTLVAHSLGAIVANDMLAIYEDVPFKDIVYMAGASTIRETMDALFPYLEDNGSTHFYNLMLHPNTELRSSGFGVSRRLALPRGSLLRWIDSFYEISDSGMDRTVGQWRNIRGMLHILRRDELANIRRQLTFRVFGEQNGPKEHGQFNDILEVGGVPNLCYKYWDRNFWEWPIEKIKQENGCRLATDLEIKRYHQRLAAPGS